MDENMRKLLLIASVLAFSANADVSEMVKECDSCHGVNGVSTNPDVPTIAGLAAFNTVDAILLYQDGARPALQIDGNDMNKVSENLDEETAEALGEYYAAQTFVPAAQAFDEKYAAAGAKIHKAKCEKCHSEGGSVADDEASILAGQWAPYMKASITSFVNGEREGDEGMIESLQAMSEKHIDALIAFYASQQ